tara:strand:+ start:271 stop:432 length:162 start_codon:yes stop_codon:yes gene_type:complete
MMTRQHFKLIARVLKECDVYEKGEGGIVEAFIRELKKENPLFKPDLFRKAVEG